MAYCDILLLPLARSVRGINTKRLVIFFYHVMLDDKSAAIDPFPKLPRYHREESSLCIFGNPFQKEKRKIK